MTRRTPVVRSICVLLIVVFSASACMKPTVPNLSIMDPAYQATGSPQTREHLTATQSLLRQLALRNPALADEIGKLPDLHDEIDAKEIQAIERIVQLFDRNPTKLAEAYGRMTKIGKPGIRKYSVPLQAFFWLAQENDLSKLDEQLEFQGIAPLLVAAWKYDDQRRWGDPRAIVDRLNAPEVFEYWFAGNFVYDWSRFWITTPTAYPQSAEESIRSKTGICFDAAYLGYRTLSQAGYDVMGLNVYFAVRTRRGGIMHSVLVLKTAEMQRPAFYKLADTNAPGSMRGPFGSMAEVAEEVARMHGVPLGRFVTGTPMYDYSLFR